MIIKPEISVIFHIDTSFERDLDRLTSSITSILFQNFLDFELILVDDKKCPELSALYQEYALRDARVIHNQCADPLPTAARHFNHGVLASSGKYLCFVSQGIEWHANALAELHVGITLKHPRCGMVFACLCHSRSENSLSNHDCFLLRIPFENVVEKSSVLLKRTAFDSLRGFNEAPQYAHCYDWDLWRRLSRLYSVVHLPIVIGITQHTVSQHSLPPLEQEKFSPLRLIDFLQSRKMHTLTSRLWFRHFYNAIESGNQLQGTLAYFIKRISHRFTHRLWCFFKRKLLRLYRRSSRHRARQKKFLSSKS